MTVYKRSNGPILECKSCGINTDELINGECWCCWDDKQEPKWIEGKEENPEDLKPFRECRSCKHSSEGAFFPSCVECDGDNLWRAKDE